jgi:hypothetical protein
MALSPAVLLLFVVTSGVGVVMLFEGMRSRLLVRRATVRCPSCGRELHAGASCRCLSGR